MKIIPIGIAVIIVASSAAAIGVYRDANAHRSEAMQKISAVKALKNGTVFDAHEEIPGTGVSVSYPSAGFYRLGADVSYEEPDPKHDNLGGLHIQPLAHYDTKKASAYVVVDVTVSKRQTTESLEDAMRALSARTSHTLEGAYSKEAEIITVGGHTFAVYTVNENVIIWNAYAISAGKLIHASLTYTLGRNEDQQAQKAYDNDELFHQILANLRF